MGYNKSYKVCKRDDSNVKVTKTTYNSSKPSFFRLYVDDYISVVRRVFYTFKKIFSFRKNEEGLQVEEADVKRFVSECYYEGREVDITISKSKFFDWNVVVFDCKDFSYRVFSVSESDVLFYLKSKLKD